jgi:hypothetical protein
MAPVPPHRHTAAIGRRLWPVVVGLTMIACGDDSITSSTSPPADTTTTTSTTAPDQRAATSAPATSTTASPVSTTTITTAPPTLPEDPMPSTPDSPVPADVIAGALVQAAIDDLVERTGADRAAIEVVSVDEVDWPNGSIGCPQPGMSYTQAIVNGTKIVLRYDGFEYDYHQGGSRPVLYCPPGNVSR